MAGWVVTKGYESVLAFAVGGRGAARNGMNDDELLRGVEVKKDAPVSNTPAESRWDIA